MNVLKMIGKPFTALAGKVSDSVRMKLLMAAARHAATLLAGVLMAHGYLTESETAEFVGLFVGLVGLLSSGAQKVAEQE